MRLLTFRRLGLRAGSALTNRLGLGLGDVGASALTNRLGLGLGLGLGLIRVRVGVRGC